MHDSCAIRHFICTFLCLIHKGLGACKYNIFLTFKLKMQRKIILAFEYAFAYTKTNDEDFFIEYFVYVLLLAFKLWTCISEVSEMVVLFGHCFNQYIFPAQTFALPDAIHAIALSVQKRLREQSILSNSSEMLR